MDLKDLENNKTMYEDLGVSIGGELNLFLVEHAIKPATMVYLDPIKSEHEVQETQESGIIRRTIRFKPGKVDELRSHLDRAGVAYIDWEEESVSEAYTGRRLFQVETEFGQKFYIARDQESLDALAGARTDREIGLALGFPQDAVEAYQKVIDGERRDGSYVAVALAKAKKAGVEIPLWLAYINHVPERLDIVNGGISPSSEKLGKRYQAFVREHNPELAHRVEQHLTSRKLADSWEKKPDGSWQVCFDFVPKIK